MFTPIRQFLATLCGPFHRGTDRPDLRSRSLLLMRLENQDSLSDLVGKAAMNHLVVRLTMVLSRAIRPEDPVEIVAPGQYAVMLTNRSDHEAEQIASRLQRIAQLPVAVGGRTVTPVLTGILVHADPPPPGTKLPDPAAMLDNARHRIEMLAPEGLGLVHLHSHDSALATQGQVTTVAAAAEGGQIEAYFQPQLCCNTGQVTGFELLARWNHPTRGLLLPGVFFSRMSSADHGALTLCMLDQGLRAMRAWQQAGFSVPGISINISNCELSDPGFATCLLWELDRHEFAPDRLVIEVLESVGPVTSNAEARRNLTMLARAGCRIDLDDFGTGYASLDAIRQFGIQRIKIDRSFVTGCDIDPGQQRMILAILALAERLGISTLAEGVETRDEHAFLAQMGCDEVQGYAIARPMPLEQATEYLARHMCDQPRLRPLLGGA